MDKLETLKNIIRNNKMSTRPEYFSGRGAITCDLNGEILEGIYKGIEKEFGPAAAKAFVKMVSQIKVLSATTFLQELYNLYYSDWKCKKTKKEADASGIAIQKNEDGNYDVTHGMIGMISAMTNDRDETQMIRGRFLINHGIKPKVGTIYTDSVNGYITSWRY